MSVPILFALLGLIVGSFLNVLILRWGVRPLTGRSACEACGRTIAWYDLVPVLSWFILRGRCRSCGEKISIQYVLVEAGTGLAFALIGLSPLPFLFRLEALPIAALLIAVAVYDLRHTLIPDAWVYTLAGLSLFASFVSIAGELTPTALLVLLAGPSTALPLFALWFFSRGTWMGLGDVKLALAMGWLLGFGAGFGALFLAFILGAIVSIPLLFFSLPLWKHIQRRFPPTGTSPKFLWGFTMKSEIPFGPFLITACLIVWFTQMYNVQLPFLSIYGL